MECKIIFKRSHDGEIEMYRKVAGKIAKEGWYWDESVGVFNKRLTKTLQQLTVKSELVLNIELHGSLTGQKENPHAASG